MKLRATLFLLFCASLTALRADSAATSRALVSSDTFLAIDDAVFESAEKMSLSLHKARKYASNPVLKTRKGGPDEWRAGFPWVLLDSGLFRMWYLARDGAGEYFTCYAESKEGYHWTYPELGIIEHNGSKANNICYKGHTLFPTIYRDEHATDPAKRYIGVIYGLVPKESLSEEQRKRYGGNQPSIKCLAYSPDGLHWTQDASVIYPLPAKVEGGTLFRMGEQWFMIHQQNSGEFPQVNKWSRFLRVSTSTDLKQWKLSEKPAFFFDPKFSGTVQTHVTPGYQNYGNVIVGAGGMFLNNAELIDHETDLTLLLSNDGKTWRQPNPSQPLSYLLRRGDRDSWDRSFVVQGNFVNTGTKTLLYYNGSQWGNVDADGIQIGIAELRLDGYGSLAPQIGWAFGQEGPFEGTAVSKPITLQEPGLKLYLNLKAGEDNRDTVSVELADANGATLNGFSFADCDRMNTDSVGLPVSWKGNTDLSALAGKSVKVKIRVTAYNAKRTGKVRVHQPHLYAFYFDKPELRLNKEQAVFGAGLERQHLSDPQYPSLEGIELVANKPVTVKMTALSHDFAELAFFGNGNVRLSGKAIRGAEVDGKKIAPESGAVSFDVPGSSVVRIALAKPAHASFRK